MLTAPSQLRDKFTEFRAFDGSRPNSSYHRIVTLLKTTATTDNERTGCEVISTKPRSYYVRGPLETQWNGLMTLIRPIPESVVNAAGHAAAMFAVLDNLQSPSTGAQNKPILPSSAMQAVSRSDDHRSLNETDRMKVEFALASLRRMHGGCMDLLRSGTLSSALSILLNELLKHLELTQCGLRSWLGHDMHLGGRTGLDPSPSPYQAVQPPQLSRAAQAVNVENITTSQTSSLTKASILMSRPPTGPMKATNPSTMRSRIPRPVQPASRRRVSDSTSTRGAAVRASSSGLARNPVMVAPTVATTTSDAVQASIKSYSAISKPGTPLATSPSSDRKRHQPRTPSPEKGTAELAEVEQAQRAADVRPQKKRMRMSSDVNDKDLADLSKSAQFA